MPNVLAPYTYAQQDIRGDFVTEMSGQYTQYPQEDSVLQPFMDQTIGYEEQIINIEPYDPRQSLIVAEAYDAEGMSAMQSAYSSTSTSVQAQANQQALTYFQKAGQYYINAYKLAPKRQDVLMPLGQNLIYQGDISDALAVFQKCYQEDPKVTVAGYEYGAALSIAGQQYYSQALPLMNSALKSYAANLSQLGNTSNITRTYEAFATYFYNQRDAANFAATMDGLAILQPAQASALNAAASEAQSGDWSKINFGSL
jgi:hypothetical protein